MSGPRLAQAAIDAQLKRARRAETRRARFLHSAAAVAERRRSRRAYAHESAHEARAILRRTFPTLLKAHAFKSLSLEAGQKLVRRVNRYEAIIKDERGGESLAVGLLPLDGDTAQGQPAPVDLTLAPAGPGLEPQSTLAPMTIPTSALGALDFSQAGFSVSFGTADSH